MECLTCQLYDCWQMPSVGRLKKFVRDSLYIDYISICYHFRSMVTIECSHEICWLAENWFLFPVTVVLLLHIYVLNTWEVFHLSSLSLCCRCSCETTGLWYHWLFLLPLNFSCLVDIEALIFQNVKFVFLLWTQHYKHIP
jgi:hypothetical protein